MKLRNFIVLILLLIVSSCKKETGPAPTEYADIEMNTIENSSGGVTYTAKINSLGKYEVLDYGFVWGEEKPKPTLSDLKISLGKDLKNENFSAVVQTDLARGRQYYVRAYVQSTKYLVYSKEKSFVSLGSLAPEITSFSPSKGFDGTVITLKGKNFSKTLSRNLVKINNAMAEVISANEEEIQIKSPFIPTSGDFKITVEVAGQTVTSLNSFSVIGPIITSVSPVQIKQGDIITVTGRYLKIEGKQISATINGKDATIVSSDSNKMIVVVPIIRDYETLATGLKISMENKIATNNLSLLQTWFKMSGFEKIAARNDLFSINTKGYCLVNQKLYEYNPENNTWNYKNDFPGNIFSGSFKFVIGSKVYMGGGVTADQINSREFWEYDQRTNGWIRLQDISNGSDYNTGISQWAFALNGLGYIWSRNGNFWCYNPDNGQWTSKNSIPNSSNINGAVILNNKAYLSHGTSLWEYNEAGDNFTFKTTCPFSSDFNGGIALQDNYFVLYSYGYPYSYNYLYKYNVSLNVWIYMQDYPCSGAAVIPAFTIGNKIYIGNFTGVGNAGCQYTLYYVVP